MQSVSISSIMFLVDIILDEDKSSDTSGIKLVEGIRRIPKYMFTPVLFITSLFAYLDWHGSKDHQWSMFPYDPTPETGLACILLPQKGIEQSGNELSVEEQREISLLKLRSSTGIKPFLYFLKNLSTCDVIANISFCLSGLTRLQRPSVEEQREISLLKLRSSTGIKQPIMYEIRKILGHNDYSCTNPSRTIFRQCYE